MYAAAAAELRLAVQTTPWVLTDNFVSATREGRGALALTGPGDPTARGQGFSFMKETAKVGDHALRVDGLMHSPRGLKVASNFGGGGGGG